MLNMNNFQVHFNTLVFPKRSLIVNRRLAFCKRLVNILRQSNYKGTSHKMPATPYYHLV